MKIFKKILFAILLVGITKMGYSQALNTTVDSTRYATIYIYRPFSVWCAIMGYGIRIKDEKLFRIRNDSGRLIKIYQPGPVFLSAKCIERKSKLVIDAEMGKSYYVRCQTRPSYITVNPKLQLTEASVGKQEYQAIVDEK